MDQVEPHVLGELLTRGELESIASELALDGLEVSDAALTRRILEHPEGEKLVVAADLGVLGRHVGDTRIGRRPPRLVVSNVTEVEAFSWSTVMRGSLSWAV